MKFKLIQFATLLIFVMSVVYLAQTPNGYGGVWNGDESTHDASSHDPNFKIDAGGYRKASGTYDPRGNSFNVTLCGADGEEYVSERGWYYRGSGEISGSHGPNTPNHKSPPEQVYRLNLEGSASATSSGATGSLSPSMDFMSALPREYDSCGGTGHIHLTITELPFHVYWENRRGSSPCNTFTAPKHEWNPDEDAEIAITVHPSEWIKTRTSEVYAEGKYEKGDFSGTFGGSYSESWAEKQKDHLKGVSYGINAHVGYGWWGAFWNPHIELQEKEAIVSGDIDKTTEYNGATVDMTANYDQAKDTLCPHNSSGTRIRIPHLQSRSRIYR